MFMETRTSVLGWDCPGSLISTYSLALSSHTSKHDIYFSVLDQSVVRGTQTTYNCSMMLSNHGIIRYVSKIKVMVVQCVLSLINI
jgi:hypothetical protein